MKKENPFRVLDGGLALCPTPRHKTIKYCWATDTRLMGVVCCCVRWQADPGTGPDLFQYFYFDYEEYGFNRFEQFQGTDPQQLSELEASLIGGLGGDKVYLSHEEAMQLVQDFQRFNREQNIPMPEPEQAYQCYGRRRGLATPEEQKHLYLKLCVPCMSEVAIANYFLMRCIGRDFGGAALLAKEGMELDLFPEFIPGTFYKNKVTPLEAPNQYQCRSVVEAGGEYYLIVTQLTIEEVDTNSGAAAAIETTATKQSTKGTELRWLVTDYQRVSKMHLSPEEIYMNMSQSEFVTVYTYRGSGSFFDRSSAPMLKNAIIHPEHDGRTFMIYRPDNKHVEQANYRLNDDLLGAIHISNGQLIASAKTLRQIHKIEINLHLSSCASLLHQAAAFEFVEPVLLRYLQSDYEDFLEFINDIQVEE